MTIAIAGSSGQVAQAVLRAATARGLTAVCTGRPHLDIADPKSIDAFVRTARADVVINAAAYTAVDKAESDRDAAFAINTTGPGELAKVCRALDVPLIHISSDYVFDGQKTGAYIEDDLVAPLSVYGISKAAGEAAVRQHAAKHVIVRTSWVYGQDGANFCKTMLRLGATRDEIGVVADQVGAPTYADDLANALLDMAERIYSPPALAPWGTYHLAGGGETSWHGFATEIFAHAATHGLKVPKVNAIPASAYPLPARRPANSRLNQDKVLSAFGIALPEWRDSLARHFPNIVAAMTTPTVPQSTS